MKKELCRDLVGKRARLLRKVTTGGGWSFAAGRIMTIVGSTCGRFRLEALRRPKPIKNRDGSVSIRSGVSAVPRHCFEVVR